MALRRISKSQYPKCLTCGTTVKARRGKYCCPGCIPKSARQAWCLKGRRTYAYRRRAIILKGYLDRLSGRSITKEELLDVLWAVRKSGYQAGFHVGQAGGSLKAAIERDAA